MNVRALRLLLNQLPPAAELWPIEALDQDQGDTFEIEGITCDETEGHVWINVRFAEK